MPPPGFQLPVLESKAVMGLDVGGWFVSPERGSSESPAPAPGTLPSCFLLCLGSLGKKKKISKEANGSADIVMSKLKSFGKLLCASVAFVDVLSSKYLLFSICIGLPKVPAFPS